MGRINNAKVSKPRSAKSLAAEYDRTRPKGLGSGSAFWLDVTKLSASKKKSKKC